MRRGPRAGGQGRSGPLPEPEAFARTYLIVHGGPAAAIDAKLQALRLPPVARDLPANPSSKVRVIWNPQGFGDPDLPGNSAQAYYPGDAYLDVVGKPRSRAAYRAAITTLG